MSVTSVLPLVSPTRLEHCTHCRRSLGYPEAAHIDDPRRNGNYVEGGGQLCDECAARVYPARTRTAEEPFL